MTNISSLIVPHWAGFSLFKLFPAQFLSASMGRRGKTKDIDWRNWIWRDASVDRWNHSVPLNSAILAKIRPDTWESCHSDSNLPAQPGISKRRASQPHHQTKRLFRVVRNPRQKLNRQEESQDVKRVKEISSLGVVSLSTAWSFQVFLGVTSDAWGKVEVSGKEVEVKMGKKKKTCKGDFHLVVFMSFGSDGKESACSVRDPRSIPGSRRFLGWRGRLPTPVFLPEKSHGQRSLAGYSPWGRKGSDTTERLTLFFTYLS